jgi:hypothetical protein
LARKCGPQSRPRDKSRCEVEELLKRHNVTEDLDTAEQVAEQITILRRLLISQTNVDLTP